MTAFFKKCFCSKWYFLFLIILLAAVVFTGNEVIGAYLFAIFAAGCLFFTGDFIPALETVLVLVCFAMRCKNSFNSFWHYRLLAIPVFVFLAGFFVRYPIKLKKGSLFSGIFASSIAVTIGGVGSISAKAYFSETSLFYIVLLGFGQLFFYCWFYGLLESCDFNYIKEKLPFIFAGVVPAFAVCLFQEYFSRFSEFARSFTVIPFQWRNNCATLIMIAMPFAFYLVKKKFAYISIVLLAWLELVFSGSRGGLLFGTVEFAICCLWLFIIDNKNRKKYLTVAACCLAAAAFAYKPLFGLLRYTIDRLKNFNENKIRLQLIMRCIEDFKANPLTGRGLIYMGNHDVHKSAKLTLCWYHCSPAQVIGSMGIVGIAAYSFLIYKRIKLYLSHRSLFTSSLLLSYVGLMLMSLVNPGIFAPVPYLFLMTVFFAFIEYEKQ
ncbi:MAG: hypothetical protein K6B52_01320 [Clostridiales bacterium]|nr:hypothetical protein [Clostridiales bacterium]